MTHFQDRQGGEPQEVVDQDVENSRQERGEGRGAKERTYGVDGEAELM